jgi:hypothetical protein
MSPPRRSTVVETGDHSPHTSKIAMAASPSKIKIMASYRCDSITTITSGVNLTLDTGAAAHRDCFAALAMTL